MSPLATGFGNSVRAFFAGVLALSIILGANAARRRDLARHRAWMIRAFAIAVAGATQAVLIGSWSAIHGSAGAEEITVLLTIGFLFNAALAEARIRRVAPQIKPGTQEGIAL